MGITSDENTVLSNAVRLIYCGNNYDMKLYGILVCLYAYDLGKDCSWQNENRHAIFKYNLLQHLPLPQIYARGKAK